MVGKIIESTDETGQKGPINPPNSLQTTDTLHGLPEKQIPIVSPDRYNLQS